MTHFFYFDLPAYHDTKYVIFFNTAHNLYNKATRGIAVLTHSIMSVITNYNSVSSLLQTSELRKPLY